MARWWSGACVNSRGDNGFRMNFKCKSFRMKVLARTAPAKIHAFMGVASKIPWGDPYSYRSASAGSTRAADALGYKVAIRLTPSDTAATSTASTKRGANGR